jgi:arylsulfatase A-like enzyme
VPADAVSNGLICHVDLLHTVAAVAEKPLPKGAGPDSFNQLPALTAEKPARPCRDSLVLQAGNVTGKALRQGSWALIADSGKKKVEPELYDLADDLAQTRNVAAKNPEKLRELVDLLGEIQKNPVSRKE